MQQATSATAVSIEIRSTSGVKSLSSLISGIAQALILREMAIGKDHVRTELARPRPGMPPWIPKALAS